MRNKKNWIVATLAVAAWLCVVLVLAPVSPVAAEEGADNAFVAQKCNMCHAVSTAGIEAKVKSEKMQGPDLAGISSRHEADWIAKFLRREVQLDGADHKKEFKGTDEELKALIAWLETQKSE